MALVTENGWPQCSRAQCETLLVPGTQNTRIEIRGGDAAVILTAWAAWWHRNIMPIDSFKPRDYWGWSATNDVWNSNHLSGTAIDLNATKLPWQRRVLDANKRDLVQRGVTLFEGTVFWGGNWNRVDEMHAQIGLPPNSPKLAEFANRLRNGYLNIYGPADPAAFPLPLGYYYGPLDGPVESISGEYESDSQAAKDGLGRWQAALGLPVTKIWNDGVTPKAAYTMQKAYGWKPNPLFGYGGVYVAEWDEVIREGWRLPQGWRAQDVTIPGFEYPLTKWGDYSQYQANHVDSSYPYEVISFRASIANEMDAKWVENVRRAKGLIAQGKLKKVIAYHFWVPGADNWGTFQRAIEKVGGVFPELAFMIDVEDGGTKWNIRGDQSVGVKQFILLGQDYFDNDQAASLYWNPTANPGLLPTLPQDALLSSVKLIVPRYNGDQVDPWVPAGVKWFGHQYTDRENTPPFGPTDMNQAKVPLSAFLAAWGTNGGTVQPPAQPDPVEPEQPTPDPSSDEFWDAVIQQIREQFDA